MELYLQRFYHGRDSTIGHLRVVDNNLDLFTIEDQYQEKKVRGETRIPSGKYTIDWKESPTPLTMKYRERYDFFNFHMEIKDVRGFNSVYIHVGNYDENTDGCLLVGTSALLPLAQGLPAGQETMIGDSRTGFKALYLKVKAALDKGEKVTLLILNR